MTPYPDREPVEADVTKPPENSSRVSAELRDQLKKDDVLQVIDRDRLNFLTSRCLEGGVCFGRDVQLDAIDRKQFEAISQYMREVIRPQMETEEWGQFQALIEEGGEKGILLSFVAHEGTRVPTWCINGGPDAETKKVLWGDNHDRPGIQVSERVYKTYDILNHIKSLEQYINSSDDTIKGRATKDLGEILLRLGQFVNKFQALQDERK